MFPLLASGIGAYTAFLNGISPFVFMPNFLAIILGLGVVIVVPYQKWNPTSRSLGIGVFLVAAFLALTLAMPGLEGVKRYLPLGPFTLNVSAMASPLLLFFLFCFLPARIGVAFSILVLIQAIHFLQPDAGQVTAFGAATLVLLLPQLKALPLRWGAAVLVLIGILATWLRPDPLPAVPQVEEILHLIADQGVFLSFAAILIGLGCFLPLLQAWRKAGPQEKWLYLGLGTYLALSLVVTELKYFFPVPLFGAGASPIFGYFTILALCAERRD